MGVNKVMVTKYSTPCKTSTHTAAKDGIIEQKSRMSKSQDLMWKEVIQQAWKVEFKLASMADFGQYKPALKEDVKKFETGYGRPGKTNMLDFETGFDRLICNNILADKQDDGKWDLPNVSDGYIMGCLYRQLKRSCNAWKSVQRWFNPELEQIETTKEMIKHVGDSTEQHLAAVTSHLHQECKYKQHNRTVETVISLKTGMNARDVETWKYFHALLEKLSVDGMSSKEEGTEWFGGIVTPVFRVKLCEWCEPAITEYFKYVNKESQKPAVCGTRGSKLHPRVQTNEPGSSPPAKWLPQSLYNPAWLNQHEVMKGKDWVEYEMQILKEVFQLLEFSAM
ncbi:hypothetical protein BDQ12DRAFT_671757 [Crucibulum laeve]|uniref:Uncharacterized protein n=1 Tax=Crucibulum laeve TaxID=68775 RepID=A0A5C3LI65_9AGAR|nr:hypothetical protein BDQ12DRAFT_671757 [Crucibulum laeve]